MSLTMYYLQDLGYVSAVLKLESLKLLCLSALKDDTNFASVMPRPEVVPIAGITYCAAGRTLKHSPRYTDSVFCCHHLTHSALNLTRLDRVRST
jgi:hypothetical protein